MASRHGTLYKVSRQCICRFQSSQHVVRKCGTSATNNESPSSSRITPLPIPGRKDSQINHYRNRNPSYRQESVSNPPWQRRSVTLHDQCYKLPEMIMARIESATNAKIESTATTRPQKDTSFLHDDAYHEIEIVNTHSAKSSSSTLSSLAPSLYHQVTITGDAMAVDHAMAVYIHYFQKAMPLVLGTSIPDDVLDVLCKECGCFMQRQNDSIYRVFPTTLDAATKMDTERMLETLSLIRSSIHRIPIPAPWHQHNGWMHGLRRYLERRATSNELQFKSGGYFWCQWVSRKDDENEIQNDDDEMDNFIDSVDDGGSIWLYQRPDNASKSAINLKQTLSEYMDHFIKRWQCLPLSSKKRPILNAKRGALWQYIQKKARDQLKVHCILSDDAILWRKIVNTKDPEPDLLPDFEGLVTRILEDVVHREINIELTEERRKELHALCAENDLIYILPDDDSFISCHLGTGTASKRAKVIDDEIRKVIDPELEPDRNVMTNEPKSDQSVRIENSEKFHVVIRMLRYLEETEPQLISEHKDKENDDGNTNSKRLHYVLHPRRRSVDFLSFGDSNDSEEIAERISTVFGKLNEVQSLSIPISMLLLLRANRGQFMDDLEQRFNVILSVPPIRDIAHILKRHKQQRRFIARRGDVDGADSLSADRVAAKLYFWNKDGIDTDHRLERYFEDMVYRKVDIPIPFDLLWRSTTDGGDVVNGVEAADRFVAKHGILSMVNHPTKAVSDSNRALKYFNPSPNQYRYWLFATNRDSDRLNLCHRDIMQMVEQCPSIDLKEMASLLWFLGTVPSVMGQRQIKWYLHTESAKLYCFEVEDGATVTALQEDLYTEMDRIWHRNCISIPDSKYGDLVLFIVESNWKRIQNVIRSEGGAKNHGQNKRNKGFLWYSTRFDALHIFCENEHILKTVESDVIEDIARNSKVIYWSEFGVQYEEYCKSDEMQQKLKALMQQSNTQYAVRGQRAEGPTMAITNYDSKELDAVYSELFSLFGRRALEDNAESSLGTTRLIPKPLILS